MTVVGTSEDGLATRTVRQLARFSPLLVRYSPYTLVVDGTLQLSGGSIITNTSTDKNLRSGTTISLNGGAETYTSTGLTSDNSALGSDANEWNFSLLFWSNNRQFDNFFSLSKSTIKGYADYSYTNSSNTNYSTTLDGKQGTTIWIEQTAGEARIDSGTIGSVTDPVLLIINGDLRLGGTVTIYGLVYITDDLSHAIGQAHIHGAMVVENTLDGSGSFAVTYDTTALTNLQNKVGAFSKVGGSWHDF